MEHFITQLIAYIFTDSFLFTFFKIILNIFSVLMLGGIAKGITKQIPSLRINKERRVLLLSILNLIIGGLIGWQLYPFTIIVNILIGSCSGFFSSVLYRVLIKTIYKKYEINVDQGMGLSSWSPGESENNKEE